MTANAGIEKLASHLFAENVPGGIIIKCRACVSRKLVDVAFVNHRSLVLGGEIKRMNREHQGCAEKLAKIEAEKGFHSNACLAEMHEGCADDIQYRGWNVACACACHESELTTTQQIGLALTYGQKEFAKVSRRLFGESDRTFRAQAKAKDELHNNRTIKFENGVLSFVSSRSGERYIITKDACSTNCPANGEIHYHRELYNLLDDSNIRPFSPLRVIDTDDERSFGFPKAA